MSFTGKDRKYRRYFANVGSRRYGRIDLLILIMFFVVIVSFVSGFYGKSSNSTSCSNNNVSDIAGTIAQSSVMGNDGAERIVRFDTENLSDEEYFPDHTPAEGVVTDGYGYRTDPSPSFHRALDIAGPYASPVYAAASGRIESASKDEIYGNHVVINHIFGGYKSKYAHLCAYVVTAGQYVEKGEIIGFMGSTGYSTGTHLHFEIIKHNERLDPAKFILIIDGRTQL